MNTEQKKITINGMENIFDVLNKGYEHLEYIKNVQKEEVQSYQSSIGMTITTFTITTDVGFDNVIISLSCGTYMENYCHINININDQMQYTPNITINKVLYNLLLGVLNNFYLQFCLTKKDKIKMLEEDFELLNDTMLQSILTQLTAPEIENLSKNHDINERIFEVSKDTINWNWLSISENPNLSLEFIRRNYSHLYLNTLAECNKNFIDFIEYRE